MANCILSSPIGPCPSEIHNMMAHDHGQAAVTEMETQGEGNYASTVFSNADQETVQGLTLPPPLQSSDQWFLDDTAVAFGEQDLDAILGPLHFDPLAVEDQTSNSDIHDLINDEYYQMEPPWKKRKLSKEAPKEASLPLKPCETAREQAVVSLLPYFFLVTKASIESNTNPHLETAFAANSNGRSTLAKESNQSYCQLPFNHCCPHSKHVCAHCP